MRLRRKHVTIASLRYVAPAAVLFIAAGFIDRPFAAAFLLFADAAAMIAVAESLGFGFEKTSFHSPLRRSFAYLALLFLYAAVVELLVGYPLRWLLRDHSLEATLALSTTTVIALLSLWKIWPAFGLGIFWRNAYRSDRNSRSFFDVASRSIEFARRITADNEVFFSHGLVVCLCLLTLVIGATTIGGWGTIVVGNARLIALAIYAIVIAPLASLLIINLTADALRIDVVRRSRAHREIQVQSESDAIAESIEQVPENIGTEELDAMLLRCVRASQTQLALAALDRGANPNCVPPAGDRDQRSVVELACVNPDMRLLRGLISKGADLNHHHAGMPPLIAATRDSFEGRPDAVMTLLTNGADARCADANGDTPLHCAALSEKPIAAALLCDAGALLDAVNAEGLTPLGVACAAANWELAKFLLERGAKTDTDHGQPAILAAASVDDDDPHGVKLLLKRKARVDARGPLKRTALMTAAMNGNAFVAQLLLDAGAQIDLADANGATALMEAARAGSADVLDVFASHKPSLDLVDGSARSALIIACQSINANEDIVRRLLDMGASRDFAVADGRCAIDFAASAGRWAIVALLDPDYPIPQSLAHQPVADEQNATGHLLDALRFGHWNVVDRFEQNVRELPEATLSHLFVELIAHDDPAPRRWLLLRGLNANCIVDGESLLALALRNLPSSLAAARDLLDAGALCAGTGVLNRLCQSAAFRTHRDEIETLGLRMLDGGADTFAPDDAGAAPLANAVAAGSISLTRSILARGADPNARDHHGRTPLFCALQLPAETATELTKLLIVAGANPDVAAVNGETPLGVALARPEPSLQQWLNWHLWKLPNRPLRNSDLLSAAAVGDVSAVGKLIALGLAVNTADAQGATPLLRAAGNAHANVVTLLLQEGADATHAATSGATALSAAVIARNADVVAALASHGVDIDQRLKGGGTALMIAAALGYPEIASALLKAGANVDASDDSHTRALHAAAHFAFHGRDGDRAKAMLNTLIEHGASIEARNSEGQTPLLLLLGAHAEAGATSDEKVLLALMPPMLKRHADVNAADNRGVTPLHACAMHGLLLPARALIDAGADPQLRDMRDRTAREVAHLLGFIDVAVELAAPRTLATSTAARKTAHDFE